MKSQPSPWTCCLAVLAAFCVGAAAQSKLKLDKPQKIKDWGYSIRTLEGWDSIAIKPEERFTVGHWKLNTDEMRKRDERQHRR